MPMIYATWHGGAGYSVSHVEDHLETFPSVRDAKEALASRERYGYWQPQTFTFATGNTGAYLTPGVEGSSMDLYFADPRETHDPYPDRRLTIGPRGGVREEHT